MNYQWISNYCGGSPYTYPPYTPFLPCYPGNFPLYTLALIDEVDLIVFDFDKTITTKHSCGRPRITDPNMLMTSNDMKQFKALIEYLLKKRKTVAIASYGQKQVINETMKTVLGNINPFHLYNIITPADITVKTGQWRECTQPPSGYSKNNMLQLLSERYRVPANKILLIDDTLENVTNAIAGGYKSFKVPGLGMAGNMPTILKNLGISKISQFSRGLAQLLCVIVEYQEPWIYNLPINPGFCYLSSFSGN